MRTAEQAAGQSSEEQAAEYLTRRGLAIVGRNYRVRLGEIDLIARDGETLVFVEVRMRSDDSCGGALESITPRKQRRIAAAANMYLRQFPRAPRCRFDVVALEYGDITWVKAAFEL